MIQNNFFEDEHALELEDAANGSCNVVVVTEMK